MNERQETAWMSRLLAKYNNAEAHVFILHLNVQDYVVGGRTLPEYLVNRFARQDLVVFYDITQGITFPMDRMTLRPEGTISQEQLAKRLLGGAAPPAADRDMMAALAALGGTPGTKAADLPRAPADALPVLERLLSFAGNHPLRAEERRKRGEPAGEPDPVRVTVVVDYAEALVPAADWAVMRDADRAAVVTLQRWALDKRIGDNNSMVLLVTRNLADLHPAIRAAAAKCEPIEIPLPTAEQRLAYISRLARELDQMENAPAWQLTPERLANATAGLGLVHIEDIAFRAKATGALTDDLVRDRKRDIISSEFGELLEIVEPRFGWERIGGLDHIKTYFSRSVITPIKTGNIARCPMGVLLIGPPGCLRGDVRVHLADGRAPTIENLAREVSDTLAPGIYPYKREVVLQDGSVATAEALHIYPASAVRTITLQDGRQITCTPNHPLLTPEGWVKAEDLRIDAPLQIMPRIPAYQEQNYRFRYTARRVSHANRHLPNQRHGAPMFPACYTPAMGTLLGLFTAERTKDSTARVSLCLNRDEEEVIAWVTAYAAELCLPLRLVPRYRAHSVRLEFGTTAAYDAFADYLPLGRERHVPEPIFHCPTAVVGAYLRGLFEGDGTISKPQHTRKVSLKTSSSGLAREVQLLLARVGVTSRIYQHRHTSPSDRSRTFTSWQVVALGRANLQRFADTVGFLSTAKRTRLERALHAAKDPNAARPDQEWMRILTIEDGYAERVYDLEVPGPTQYVANGITSHNTGKSAVAEALAHEAGINFVFLRMGKILGSYVGSSERNLEKALRAIESLAPCGVFVDEIDQAMPGRSSGGDSGVGGRIFGRLLDFMAQPTHRGRVFWLAASNRVDKLDAALRRPGRFDKKIPFLVPDAEERRTILAVMARAHG
ncbi:MAG TPA: AAA family ATPase, partial [Chloroflexota bacterium]|nr:AAA family ATPase [Chloroflexota bacterium]